MTARRTRALIVLLAAAGMVSCGDETKTVTQPASTAPLGRPIGGPDAAPARADARARPAARSFLTSYLDVSYGRAKPDALRNAAKSLRESISAQQARVPQGVRNRRPRVVSLRLEPAGTGRVHAIASIDDGDVAPYPLFATLTRTGAGRWVAISVGG
jgi:hypothetical protein